MPAIPIRYSTVSSANACDGIGTTNLNSPDFPLPGSDICDSVSVSDSSFNSLSDGSTIWIAQTINTVLQVVEAIIDNTEPNYTAIFQGECDFCSTPEPTPSPTPAPTEPETPKTAGLGRERR